MKENNNTEARINISNKNKNLTNNKYKLDKVKK